MNNNLLYTMEIFRIYACKYLRKQDNLIQGSLDSIHWFNI